MLWWCCRLTSRVSFQQCKSFAFWLPSRPALGHCLGLFVVLPSSGFAFWFSVAGTLGLLPLASKCCLPAPGRVFALSWCYCKSSCEVSVHDCNSVTEIEGAASFSLLTCHAFVKHWRRNYLLGQPFFTRMCFPPSHPRVVAPLRNPAYLGHVANPRADRLASNLG